MTKMRKVVRKLRHWKQRWDKNAEFVWRRRTQYAGKVYEPGDPLPDALNEAPTKLRRFWESQRIELAEFEEPNVATGQVETVEFPEGVTVEKGKGSWSIVTTPDGQEHKVNGVKALDELLKQLHREAEQPKMLLGSSVLESTYEIESETITLGEIIAITQEDSGLTVDEWNALVRDDPEQTEALLAQSLAWMQDQGEDEEQPEDDASETKDATDTSEEQSEKDVTEQPEDDKDETPETPDDQADKNTVAPKDDDWLDGEGKSGGE